MPTIKGTASVTDDHAMAKQLKQTKFPKTFNKKVRIDKVNVPVMTQWIERRIAEILGFEDEIVASMATNLFLEAQDSMDPRRAQLNLVGFLGEEQSALFSDSLWSLLLDAQDQASGIPTIILEEKKEQMRKEKEERDAEEARVAAEKRMEHEKQQTLRQPTGSRQAAISEHHRRVPLRRDFDRRPPSPNLHRRHAHGHRLPPPPRPISPVQRHSIDEFGRVTQNDDDVRKPRAYDGDRGRSGRSYRDLDNADLRHERWSHRDGNRDRHRSSADGRNYARYSERDEYRVPHSNGERGRRRSRSSSSSSSRSSSRSRSNSTSRSRSTS